jgi:glycerol-3-phosphate dehydrogenase (NAD(P)+)
MHKISVIGDGGWGTALAIVLNSKGIDTVLWSYSAEYAEKLRVRRENVKFLPGIRIPGDINITSRVGEAAGSECMIFAVPCKYMRPVLEQFKGAGFKYVISATKGIENGTLMRPSEILAEFFDTSRIGVLSGPSISHEVAMLMPTTVVLAAPSEWGKEARGVLTADRFRVYSSTDLIGVELGGALKNVIAIAAGISDGMGFGANTKAGLLTRGLSEITRLGVAMGAKRETFSGLSGIGDLVTTCMSAHSRNRWFGEEIGKGSNVKDTLNGTEMVVEGALTAASAYQLAEKYSVDMPITAKIYEIIYEGKDPRAAVKELMARDLKEETHGF